MSHPVLAFVVAAGLTGAPLSIDLNAKHKDPISAIKQNPSLILIAQLHQDDDPHGDDPHDEQHKDSRAPKNTYDENHDSDIPANRDRHYARATKHVYGGDIPDDIPTKP